MRESKGKNYKTIKTLKTKFGMTTKTHEKIIIKLFDPTFKDNRSTLPNIYKLLFSILSS